MFDLIVMMILSCEIYAFFDDIYHKRMKYVFAVVPLIVGTADILHRWGVW
jgi:hypothetical protein